MAIAIEIAYGITVPPIQQVNQSDVTGRVNMTSVHTMCDELMATYRRSMNINFKILA